MAIKPQNFRSLQNVRIIGTFDQPIVGATIDSRKVAPGNLFVALPGENTDGHTFIPNAIKSGASAVLCNANWAGAANWNGVVPLITVPDVTIALGELARNHRRNFDLPILAITGTNGKTTTKNMIATILAKRYFLLKTEGNLNNQLGLPLTLLHLDESHTAAVLEMGASHAGDIAYLCEIAEPTEGLITNVGHAHLEYFKSIENVQKVKGELFSYLGDAGTRYVNSDDSRVMALVTNAVRCVNFSETSVAGMSLEISGKDEWGCFSILLDNKTDIQLKVSGSIMVQNAAAAIAVGLTHQISQDDIKSALENYPGEKGRMQRIDIHGFHVIHDAYNANPESSRQSITTVAKLSFPKRRIVVFADMLELGESSSAEHAEIGKIIADNAINAAFLYGPETVVTANFLRKNASVLTQHFNDKNALGDALAHFLMPGDVVLLKGSRSMGLETLIPVLERHS